jgi:predicted MPP superfamily phosphohydrolase
MFSISSLLRLPGRRKAITNPIFKLKTSSPALVLIKNPKRFSHWRALASQAPQAAATPMLWLGLGLVLLVGLGIYGFWGEPYWIETTHYQLDARFSSPLKIAHLTDLHTYGLGRREEDMLALLDKEKPDLIAITGDTLAQSGTYEMCRQVLSRLHAPLGVWAVPGNYENYRRLENEVAFYESLNVHYLQNSSHQIRDGVWIAGVDDAISGSPNLGAALAFVPREAYTIVLTHSPTYFQQLAGHCNLVLAGHSHGGQVRIPFLSPLWTPSGTGRFVAGWFEQDRTKMYVSRGMGTTIIDMRLFCRPELDIITLGW